MVFPALEGAETVYHVAGLVAFGRRARPALRAVNVGGTATVVDAALAGGVGRLVHTSSIAALGRPARFTGVLDEDSRWTDSPANTGYARAKRDADLEVARGVAEGLDAVTVVPAVVFGPGRRGEGTMAIVERAASGLVLAPPGGTAVVDVEDVARGMRLAAERGVTGRRYVLAAENRLWTDLLGTIADAAGARRPRAAPPWALVGAARVSQAWAAASRSAPALTVAQARGSAGTYRYDGSRADARARPDVPAVRGDRAAGGRGAGVRRGSRPRGRRVEGGASRASGPPAFRLVAVLPARKAVP